MRKLEKWKYLLTILISIVGSGCSTTDLNRHYAGPQILPVELAAEFAYEPLTEFGEPIPLGVNKDGTQRWKVFFESPFQPTRLKFDEAARKYFVEHLDLTALPEVWKPEAWEYFVNYLNKTMTEMLWYIPNEPIKGWVIILPILNGDNTLERYFARYFARRGYAAAIINGHERGLDFKNLDNIDEAIKKMVTEQRLGLDFLCSLPEMHSENIFLFGMSMGAIKAVYLAALDERVTGSAIILGGSNFPHLLTHSKMFRDSKDLTDWMGLNGIDTLDELEIYLEKNIAYDTGVFAKYIDAEKTYMVIARNDHIVPYITQQWLRQAIGGPKATYLITGHLSSIFYIPVIQVISYQHFESMRNLEE